MASTTSIRRWLPIFFALKWISHLQNILINHSGLQSQQNWCIFIFKLISVPESWKIGRFEFVSAIEDLPVYIYCRIDVVCGCSRSMASFKDRIGISPVEFTVEKWRYRHINIAIEQHRKHGANIMRIPFTISQNFWQANIR